MCTKNIQGPSSGKGMEKCVLILKNWKVEWVSSTGIRPPQKWSFEGVPSNNNCGNVVIHIFNIAKNKKRVITRYLLQLLSSEVFVMEDEIWKKTDNSKDSENDNNFEFTLFAIKSIVPTVEKLMWDLEPANACCVSLFTSRVRSTREGNVFTLFVRPQEREGGTPARTRVPPPCPIPPLPRLGQGTLFPTPALPPPPAGTRTGYLHPPNQDRVPPPCPAPASQDQDRTGYHHLPSLPYPLGSATERILRGRYDSCVFTAGRIFLL